MLWLNSTKKSENLRARVVLQFNGCGNRYSFETIRKYGGQLKEGIFKL